MNNLNRNLIERIRDTAKQYPDNIAICNDYARITYKELLESFEHSAGFFRERGLKREELVCIEAGKSIELIICILGVISAGGAYVLLDKDMPKERKEQIRNILTPRFSITDDEMNESDSYIHIDNVILSTTVPNVVVSRSSSQLVYVAFTSGSTGEAKGVEIEDYNIQSYCDAYIQYFTVTKNDKMLQLSKLSFDGFTEEVFVPLLCGATIVIPEKDCEKHPRLICNTINRHQITLCATTPLMMNELNNINCSMPSLRVLISAGDILRKKYFNRLLKSTQIYNMYGPTETTVCVTVHKCTDTEEGDIPLGNALPNNKLVIVDENCVEVGKGVNGEILVVGAGVGRGYYKDPQLTSERFVSYNGVRAYHTGDFAYCNEGGEYVFAGRMDRQVKVRGFRVELLEIERVALKYPGIDDAAVVVEDVGEDKRVILVYTSVAGIKEKNVLAMLQRNLPEYMIPRVIKHVNSIPETDRGKRDVEMIVTLIQTEQNDSLQRCLDLEENERRFLDAIASEGRQMTFQDNPALIWDSISFISAIVALENEYNIVFDDEYLMIDRYPTVKALFEYVQHKNGG